MCPNVCRFLQRPEKDIRFSETEITAVSRYLQLEVNAVI